MNKTLEAQRLEIALIQLMESHLINSDDYNLIHQHLNKIKSELALETS